MQRAAAAQTAPESPQAEPSPKRRKVSAQDEAIRAELAFEEAKRAEALARQAAQAGETRWAFSLLNSATVPDASNVQDASRGFQVITAGYASIDNNLASVEETEEDEATPLQANNGRRRFGAFQEDAKVSRIMTSESLQKVHYYARNLGRS